MKKILLASACVTALFVLTSCDNKLCYCYERTSDGILHETEVYVSNDTPCNSMSRGNRGCIESSERGTINPDDIAK